MSESNIKDSLLKIFKVIKQKYIIIAATCFTILLILFAVLNIYHIITLFSIKNKPQETYTFNIDDNIKIQNQFSYNKHTGHIDNNVSILINDTTTYITSYENLGDTPKCSQADFQLILNEDDYKVYYLSKTIIYDSKDSKSRIEKKPIVVFKNGEVISFTSDSSYGYRTILGSTDGNHRDIKIKIALNEIDKFYDESMFFESYNFLNSLNEYKKTLNNKVSKYLRGETVPSNIDLSKENKGYINVLNTISESRWKDRLESHE